MARALCANKFYLLITEKFSPCLNQTWTTSRPLGVMLLQPTPRVPLIHQLQNHLHVNIHTLLKLETQLVFTIKETEIDFDKHPIIYAYLFYTNNGPKLSISMKV